MRESEEEVYEMYKQVEEEKAENICLKKDL